jgi:hypothetical protein
MSCNTGEQWKDVHAAAFDERDPQPITDLIEQLDRDLAETLKNAAKGR